MPYSAAPTFRASDAALKRAQLVTEGLQVGRLGLLEVLERLGVGGHAAGLVTGLEQIFLRLLPVFGARVVVGQQAGELVQPIGEQRLDGLRHAAVNPAPALGQNAAVGRFLRPARA